MRWHCHGFDDFGVRQLYEVLQLRDQVFVVEQQSIYGDLDGLDQRCRHLSGRDGSERLLAYARLLAPGVRYPDAVAIGRVVVAPDRRGGGLGRLLMLQAIHHCEQLYPGCAIMLSAQAPLQRFYEGLGFVVRSDPYDDGGMLHVDMYRHNARA
ncbi:GNAT family N-acetyltransferase [Vogesella fluminis]|uniref:GNAT family N-acetyltransferase n=1 Tax=Vogesella fluminis TaxID=1069161 RepID=UPI001E385178|nr:GNAT family N-acetyltransferase [Vogesella fluminis]